MMLEMKEMLSKCGLTAFSVSVFHHVVLLLLTDCCEGQSQVVGPSQPIIVRVGDDVILPCNLKPATDAVGMTLEWARPDLKPRFVHVWHKGQDFQVNQHSSYKGRTSLSIERLKHGDISLKLSKVKLYDNGKYRCYLPDLNKDSTVELVVETASSPAISLLGTDTSISGVMLQCESKGWYLQPEVFWLDGEGSVISAGPTETVRGPYGLYTVSSRVTVEKRHSNNFTCRVQLHNINQTRETHIIIPGDFFIAQCSYVACITISLAAFFMCVSSAVVFLVWKWRQNETKNKMKTGKNREEQQLIGSNKRKMDDTLKELNNQKNELNSQKEAIRKLEERTEETENQILPLVEGFNGTQEYMKLKESMLQHKGNLRNTVGALDRLKVHTDILLYETESVIKTIEELKEEENHMEK